MSARNNADQVVFGVRSLTFTSGAQSPGRILGALLAIGRPGVLVNAIMARYSAGRGSMPTTERYLRCKQNLEES